MDWTETHEHRATQRLLQAPALAHKFDPTRHLDADCVDFEALLSDCFASSKSLLARVAWDLWNGCGDVCFRELLLTFGPRQLRGTARCHEDLQRIELGRRQILRTRGHIGSVLARR